MPYKTINDKFWSDHFDILFKEHRILEILPIGDLSLERKLNAATRLLIILTILGYFFTHSNKLLVSTAVVLVVMAVLYKTLKIRKHNSVQPVEAFTGKGDINYQAEKHNYTTPTKENPMMNVLLPEINEKPDRLPAAPAFNKEVRKEINEAAKDERLFADLGDNISFNRSMRNFHSMPNTQIPNDREGFRQFCYGDTGYCKNTYNTECSI